MFRFIAPTLITVATALTFGTTALAQTTEKDGLLRDLQGQTLYTFDKDSAQGSQCYEACATAWPPFMAKPEAKASGSLTLHPRKDGTQQWGWQGKPLYYFAADTQAGDTRGDGQGGVWHIIKIANSSPSKSNTSSPNSSYSY